MGKETGRKRINPIWHCTFTVKQTSDDSRVFRVLRVQRKDKHVCNVKRGDLIFDEQLLRCVNNGHILIIKPFELLHDKWKKQRAAGRGR